MVQSLEPASVELYFMHGWGFNSQIWQEWTLPSLGNVVRNKFDRGYFSKANMTFPLDSHALRVLIVHSFGLHMVPKELFAKIDFLVLISSFNNFLTNSNDDRVQKKKLAIMRRKFSTHPKEVLADFYLECGIDAVKEAAFVTFETLNQDFLKTDLDLLVTSSFDLALLSSIPRILLLHGENDRVVSINQSKILQSKLSNSHLFIIPQGEHALPLLNYRECADLVEAMLLPILELKRVDHQ